MSTKHSSRKLKLHKRALRTLGEADATRVRGGDAGGNSNGVGTGIGGGETHTYTKNFTEGCLTGLCIKTGR